MVNINTNTTLGGLRRLKALILRPTGEAVINTESTQI